MENDNIGDGMSFERYEQITTYGGELTDVEISNGWHWCGSWDDMLVGPGMDTALTCKCNIAKINEWVNSEGGQQLKKLLQLIDEELNNQNPFSEEDYK